jgi:hypothetical protein
VLDADSIPAGVSFSQDYSKILHVGFPKSILLNHHKLNEIEKISLYLEKDDSKQLVASTEDFSNLFNGQILLTWQTAPAKGIYNLIAEVIVQGGESKVTDQVTITIK